MIFPLLNSIALSINSIRHLIKVLKVLLVLDSTGFTVIPPATVTNHNLYRLSVSEPESCPFSNHFNLVGWGI